MSIGYGNRKRRNILGMDSDELLGNTNFSNSTSSLGALPEVSDPEQTFADITRQQYLDFVTNYGQFEEDLIQQASTDTSLIDAAREDSEIAGQLAGDLAMRNASRYGVQLTPAQMREQSRGLQRNTTLGSIQALADARIAQRETNQRTLSDLINIGQGLNRSSLAGMQSAAGNAAARQRAFENAKAQSKAQTYSTIGSLASTAILALAI